MKFKLQGTYDNETLIVTVQANSEKEAIDKAKQQFKLKDIHIINSRRIKEIREHNRLYDKAWSRKSAPYVKVSKGKTVMIFS